MPSKLELIIEDVSTTVVVNIEDNPRRSDTMALSTTTDSQLTRNRDGYYVPPTSWEDLRDQPNSTAEEIDDAGSRSEQNASSIEGLEQSKVDKVVGKELATEDYSTAEKNKLGGIEAGAQVNSVTSVAGKTGVVTLNKTDVGLSNVDNTSDSNKPVSTPQQTALDGKVDKVEGKGLSTEDFTSAEKGKLSGIQDGATANATDAQLRDRATHTGVQPISSISGLQTELDDKADTAYVDTQLDCKVDKTVSVVAGTGLSGGGALSANRTLNVQYGATAGTAAQGNDSRLSNSREWTASTVPQEEAETGTATTARKWTAQRVRQAVEYWWSGSADKTKLDGIAAGATANATDAQLRDRATHTGVQAIGTIFGLQDELDSINTLVGDVATALDAINGEVV